MTLQIACKALNLVSGAFCVAANHLFVLVLQVHAGFAQRAGKCAQATGSHVLLLGGNGGRGAFGLLGHIAQALLRLARHILELGLRVVGKLLGALFGFLRSLVYGVGKPLRVRRLAARIDIAFIAELVLISVTGAELRLILGVFLLGFGPLVALAAALHVAADWFVAAAHLAAARAGRWHCARARAFCRAALIRYIVVRHSLFSLLDPKCRIRSAVLAAPDALTAGQLFRIQRPSSFFS